jgi:uncharacterized protein YkwD
MLKAGKMVLLATALCAFLGAVAHTHAQEKLSAYLFAFNAKSHRCTSIDEYLVTKTTLCEDTVFTQAEIAIKAETKENPDETSSFSYSTEPTFYVPPTPTEAPTVTPTPTTEPQKPTDTTQAPADNVPADASSLNSDVILDLINAHRAQIGKPAFLKDESLCALATTRSMELHDELFINHNLHSGLYNRNLPYWITEDAKWGSNEAGTVNWWLNSPIHRAAIEGDYTYSCGACNGSMCSQLFTSYTPKTGFTASATTTTAK